MEREQSLDRVEPNNEPLRAAWAAIVIRDRYRLNALTADERKVLLEVSTAAQCPTTPRRPR